MIPMISFEIVFRVGAASQTRWRYHEAKDGQKDMQIMPPATRSQIQKLFFFLSTHRLEKEIDISAKALPKCIIEIEAS